MALARLENVMFTNVGAKLKRLCEVSSVDGFLYAIPKK